MGKKLTFVFAALLLLVAGSVHHSSHFIADSMTVTITGEIVNVREKPGTSHSVITRLSKGETYPLEGESEDWYQIKLPSGNTGWIANWLASKDINNSEKETGLITADGLNVRADAKIDSAVVGKLNKGNEVTIISETDDWTQILFQSKTAWISSQYVKKKESNNYHTSNNKQNIVILHDSTNIRKKPDLRSNIVSQAHAGEVYEIIDRQGDWYRIKSSSGQDGYVASWIVSLTTQAPTASKKRKGIAGKTIVIDPGHGGRDQGAKGVKGTLEKDLTLETALLLAKKLKKSGAAVILTRTGDQTLSLRDRISAASLNEADAFISIHYDSVDNPSAAGHTTYYYYFYEKQMAETIHRHLTGGINLHDRGTQFGDYFVLRENHRPSILLELGYLSNKAEEKSIKTKRYREKATDAIAEGLKEYFN